MSLWCDDFYVTPQGYYVIKVITRLLHQGISKLLRHDQSQTVSKSAYFRCEKMHFCSSESRESRIFGISALKTIVLKNKTELFSTCNWSIFAVYVHVAKASITPSAFHMLRVEDIAAQYPVPTRISRSYCRGALPTSSGASAA